MDVGAGYVQRCGGSTTPERRSTCITMAWGMNEALKAAKRASPTFPLCLPEGADLSKNLDVFWRYLHENPRRLGEPTRDLYVEALIAAYPCEAPRALPPAERRL